MYASTSAFSSLLTPMAEAMEASSSSILYEWVSIATIKARKPRLGPTGAFMY